MLIMNSTLQKYEFFSPRKVYHCACLLQPVEESFDAGEHSFVDILFYVKNFDFAGRNYELLSDKIFCTRVGEEKKDCLFVCEKHLAIDLLATRKIICTSTEKENTAIVTYDNKKEVYCEGCIKHYMRLMYSYFYFVDFDQSF